MYFADENEIEAVRRVFQSGRLFRNKPGGGECDHFEKEFSDFLGHDRRAILVNSGTNALVAALAAAGIGPGDEVLVPAYTFVATPASVKLVGAKPVIVEIDENLGMSAEDAGNKITSKTKAILPVHMDGLSANLPDLSRLAKEKALLLIEDCAQSFGGSCEGQQLGTWGDAAAFSLNENKILSCGEGGIAVSSNPQLYSRMFVMQDLSSRYNPLKKDMLAGVRILGASMRVSDIQGALMRVQFSRLPKILSGLRSRKTIFTEALKDVKNIGIVRGACPDGDCASSLHLRFQDPLAATEASRRLLARKIPALFPTMRPAHVAWKWLDLIDPEGDRPKFATSQRLLMSMLKYDIDLHLSLEETRDLAVIMSDVLGEL